MKQILLILILAGAVYMIFWSGAIKVLSKADIKPQNLISTIAAKVEDENFVPEVATARRSINFTNPDSYQKLKETIFLTYDPDVCFAFVDLAYSSNLSEAGSLIDSYLKMFNLPEDKSRISALLNSYKDKKTLQILLSLYNKGSLDKANLLNMMSVYHTPEVAKLINQETQNENKLISRIATQLAETFKEQDWYVQGLEFDPNTENSLTGLQKDKINSTINLDNYMGE